MAQPVGYKRTEAPKLLHVLFVWIAVWAIMLGLGYGIAKFLYHVLRPLLNG